MSLVEVLQQTVSREFDLLVPPLRRPVDARDERTPVHVGEVTVDERVPRLGLLPRALGQPEVPRPVAVVVVPVEERVLGVGIGLDVTPVAVEDDLAGLISSRQCATAALFTL